jgi:hypothetical protein
MAILISSGDRTGSSKRKDAEAADANAMFCLSGSDRPSGGDHCKILTDLGTESALNIYARREGIMGNFGWKSEAHAGLLVWNSGLL